MQKNFLLILLTSLGMVGCATSNITNLTPAKVERNSTGMYPVEMAWSTREHAQRPQSLQPKVQVGLQEYQMQQTPIVKNRWETLVPIPAHEKRIHYRFKVDYEYNAIPVPRKNSKLSPEYTLEVIDK